MNRSVCVFCASSNRIEQRWLDLAFTVGAALGRHGHTLVSGGGRVGMMGTVGRGARSVGGRTVGIIPQLLVDWEVADHDSDELIITDGMAGRKTLMIERSDAFLTLPGGLGTLDELFEVWTTGVIGVHDKPIVLLNVDDFYTPILGWLRDLVAPGFVTAAGQELLTVVDTVEAALEAIR
jgi:uncharacterized protein (TIGR00730 family)